MSDLGKYAFSCWPSDVPRPTEDEIAAATKRYEATVNPEGQGDYGCGLGFVMSTYNRWIWWPFFFPDAPKLDPMVDFPDDPPAGTFA